MGYATCFAGAFKFSEGKKLSVAQYVYLFLFHEVPRFKRDPQILAAYPDPLREAVGLPMGPEGEYFVSSKEFFDLPEGDRLSIVQQVDPVTRWYSTIGQCKSAEDTWRDLMAGADSGMPSEPLSWLPTRDLTGFAWDGDECRGHQFAQWLQWISDNILKHWDLQLEGHVWYQGEDLRDTGRIFIAADGSIVQESLSKRSQDSGRTMLQAAASNDVGLARTLPLEQLSMKDGFGRTPLMLALWFRSYDMVDWLCTNLQEDTWQLDACCSKEMWWFDDMSVFDLLPTLDTEHPTVPRLLSHLSAAGFNPSILDRFVGTDSHSPLTRALTSNNHLLTKWLLDNGADVNLHQFSTALPSVPPFICANSWPVMIAANRVDTRLLQLLLARGARVHVERRPEIFSGGETVHSMGPITPLHLAAYNGRWGSVRLLVEYGADLKKRCNMGYMKRAEEEKVSREAVGMRTSRPGPRGDEEEVREARAQFDAAVEVGLEKRRLLVLGGLRPILRNLSFPEHLLRRIFESADLF